MNSMAFTPDEVKKGFHLDLVNYLLDYNNKSDQYYNDVHITSDGFCTIIEWEHIAYEYKSGSFQFVDDSHAVLKEVVFPDNHIELLYDEEVDEALNKYNEEHRDDLSIIY